MAAHGATAAAQNSVAERRLRPIYDWLDNGNNKKALQEAEKVLKKQPDFQCCKVLKSLALLRLGRENEAQPVLDSVLNEGPTDDGTLQAMTIAFRELQQPEKICTMYEKATSREQSEELLSHLFMSYVRMGYYKKQQQAAMQLYKVKPKNPYYFWAVMSIVLQATTGRVDESLTKNMLLPLAERMIAKMAKEKKMEQEQETHLYLMVLELQKKFQEALNILDGPVGKQLEDKTSYWELCNTKKIDYLKKLQKWEQVNSLAKDVLQQNPDQWSLYLDYITSVFHIIDDNIENKGEVNDETVDKGIEDAVSFITFQQDHHTKCRAPFLAQMELQSRLIARRDPNVDEKDMVTLMVKYFKKFGSKQCASMDLQLFLPSLQHSQADEFFKDVFEEITFDGNSVPCNVDQMHRHVNWYQLRRFWGHHNSPLANTAKRCQVVGDLINIYENCLPLVKDFKPTEICPNDGYIMLAGQILWDLWMETEKDYYLWQAIVNLTKAQQNSNANYQLRFLLIKFYNHIGAVGPSQVAHAGLELKHIQLDSLGYLISRHIASCGHFNETAKYFRNTLRFFNGNYKDTIDHIISAYRCGSFDKIREFIKLRDRLSASQHFASISVEQKLLDLMTETALHGQTVQMMSCLEIDIDKDSPDWSGLTDNRDFKAIHSWDPTERALTDEIISESFLLDQKFLKFRSLTIRSLATAVYMSEDIHPSRIAASRACQNEDTLTSDMTKNLSDSERASLLLPVLEKLIECLEQHKNEVESDPVDFTLPNKSAFGPDSSRLTLYVKSFHTDMLITLLRFTLSVYKLVSTKESSEQQTIQQSLEKLSEKAISVFQSILNNLAEALNTQGTKFFQRHEMFESIINVLDSISFAAILCGVCYTFFRSGNKFRSSATQPNASSNSPNEGKTPITKSSKKKGNKNQIGVSLEMRKDLATHCAVFNEMVLEFGKTITSLFTVVEKFEEVVGRDQLIVVNLINKFSRLVVTGQIKDEDNQTNSETTNHVASNHKSKIIDEMVEKTKMDLLGGTQQDILGQLESSFGISFLQIKTVIQNKQNYFNFLKCDIASN